MMINKIILAKNGWTDAHEMAHHGHVFSVDEIIALGNPALRIESEIANFGTYPTPRPAGWTVAHEMASLGHQFKISELLALGNPQAENGLTPAHLMAIHGYVFSPEELAQFPNPMEIKAAEIKSVHLTYHNGRPVFAKGEKVKDCCSLFFGYGYGPGALYVGSEIQYGVAILGESSSFSKLSVIVFIENWIWDGGEFNNQKPKVIELANQIADAIRKKQTFDLASYEEYWHGLDNHFLISLGDYRLADYSHLTQYQTEV